MAPGLEEKDASFFRKAAGCGGRQNAKGRPRARQHQPPPQSPPTDAAGRLPAPWASAPGGQRGGERGRKGHTWHTKGGRRSCRNARPHILTLRCNSFLPLLLQKAPYSPPRSLLSWSTGVSARRFPAALGLGEGRPRAGRADRRRCLLQGDSLQQHMGVEGLVQGSVFSSPSPAFLSSAAVEQWRDNPHGGR